MRALFPTTAARFGVNVEPRSRILPSSLTSHGHLSSSPPKTSVSGVGPILYAGDDVAASVEAPYEMMLQVPSTRPMPETVREAMNFMKNATMPSVNLSV